MTLEETLSKKKILSLYYTAGYPTVDSTVSLAIKLQKSGADMIEIGIPYSDPIADGLLIQKSNQIALENGISLKKILKQLENIKKYVSIPILLMGYFNPIFQFGVKKFISCCKKIGIEGVIIPDLPIQEYCLYYKRYFEKENISMIFLITPQTQKEKIKKIKRLSKSFIYAISSNTITGQSNKNSKNKSYFARLKKMNSKIPILIGFGINDKSSFDFACSYGQGGIVGSHLIKMLPLLKEQEDFDEFTQSLRQPTATGSVS